MNFINNIHSTYISRFTTKLVHLNIMSASLKVGDFDTFYNALCVIDEQHNSWIDEDYADAIAELKWQRYCKKKKIMEYKLKLNSLDYSKHRELDLRRMLLHKIGKYELEEGEIFE